MRRADGRSRIALPRVPIRRATAGLLLACVVALRPGPAEAFRRSVSEEGAYLYWSESSVAYVLDEAGCADVVDHSDRPRLRTSFASWSGLACTDGPLCMTFVDGGLVSGKSAGYSQTGANENLIIFLRQASDWQERGYAANAIAMTSVTHDKRTGRIYDADIEFNDAGFRFNTTDLPLPIDGVSQDLQNAATHEIGHIVGLDHSTDVNSTMYSEAMPGERKKRTLSPDDLDGACTIYPPCPDRGGGGGVGCRVAPTAAPAGGPASGSTGGPDAQGGSVLLGLLLGLGVVVRRRPRK